jgi:tetratricopeptide (TPR) repeat protein
MRKHIEKINKAIEIVFYAIFLTVPLAMHPYTSELFEFNKMWLVYIYSLILFFLWGTKVIIQRKFELRRTPFDILLLLFLLSQVISTVISLDPHTSFWGYYSRFNGGLLSSICYIFLYFAFSTNILTGDREESIKKTMKMLFAIFLSGILVALWGLPSHFGYDPTCLVFRGTLDVSCWTDAFQPKVRMFSTLGQPNWLAAFLLIQIPIAMSYAINWSKKIKKNELFATPLFVTVLFILSTLLFYLDLTWTLSQSGFIGFWVGDAIFVILFAIMVLRKNSKNISHVVKQRSFQVLIGFQLLFLLATFLTTNPIPRFQKFSVSHILSQYAQQNPAKPVDAPSPVSAQPALESGITGSGDIRKIVWRGAIDIWKAHPLFGSGVETYAYAYYKFRPAEHNLTSEWDYLYNKAHNEFLNYLATTGAFGLGTYLLFIGAFLFFAFKNMHKQWNKTLIGNPIFPALIGGFVGIQVSNFFGFSVVIVNLLMFLIPLFYWSITNPSATFFVIPRKSDESISSESPGTGRVMVIVGLGAFCLYCIFFLINYWNADINYALGYNYNRINEFSQANPYLEKAVKMRGGEDLYKNELSVNLAALALAFAQQKDLNNASQFATRAKELSDEVAAENPNNVVYWKARTRVMFSLAELSPTFMSQAVAAIEKSHQLAPTDAKVLYNEALIYDQVGQKDKALQILNETIKIRSNYEEAYYAKALFLSQIAEENKKDKVKSDMYKKEATDVLKFILKTDPSNEQAKSLLKTL